MSSTSIEVALRPPYRVHVGAGALAGLADAAAPFERCALLTDTRVEALHAGRLGAVREAPRLALEPGEGAKTLAGLERVLDFLVEARLDRRSLLVTFGGGVVSDLGGLAASLYMRGIQVVHAPTTLLAQVDAAIGGKTAVDLRAGKNLAGTFHQPCAVLCDTELLTTLDQSELRSGLGEVVKTALLGAPGLMQALETDAPRIVACDPETLATIVAACVRLKAGVVAADEREGGQRRALNLGHSFGHAIEHAAGYGRIPHGVAVAVGLAIALEAARRLGRLEQPDLPGRVRSVLAKLGLPASLDELRSLYGAPLAREDVLAALRVDKKASGGEVALVLPRAVGQLDLEARPGQAFLEALLEDA